MGVCVSCEKRARNCSVIVFNITYEDIAAATHLSDFRQNLITRFDLTPDFRLLCSQTTIDS